MAAKWTIATNIIFFYKFIGFPNSLLYAHLFDLHNEHSPMPVRLKTVGGVGFEVTGNVTFQERGLYNVYIIENV